MRFKKFLAPLLALLLAAMPAAANEMSNATWSESDSSNNSASPNGWTPGSMLPNQVEPTAQAMMGALKRWWDRDNPVVTTAGTAPHYTYTPNNASFPAAYVQGEKFCAKADKASAGGDDFNVSGLGAKPLYALSQLGAQAILANEIEANALFCAVYDGALNSSGGGFWLLTNPQRPAKVVLSAVTASNSANVQFQLPAGFGFYEIDFFNAVPAVLSNGFQLQISSNACAAMIGTASYETTTAVNAQGSITGGFAAASAVTLTSGISQAADAAAGHIAIYPVASATLTHLIFQSEGGSALWWNDFGSAQNQSAAANCLQITAGGGNIATGTFVLYGERTQ